MKNYIMILIEKLPKYQFYHQTKYEYLTGEEILSSNQKQIIEQAKFTYSPLGKAFEKQIKTNEDQGKKNWGFKRFKTRRTKSNWDLTNFQCIKKLIIDY